MPRTGLCPIIYRASGNSSARLCTFSLSPKSAHSYGLQKPYFLIDVISRTHPPELHCPSPLLVRATTRCGDHPAVLPTFVFDVPNDLRILAVVAPRVPPCFGEATREPSSSAGGLLLESVEARRHPSSGFLSSSPIRGVLYGDGGCTHIRCSAEHIFEKRREA